MNMELILKKDVPIKRSSWIDYFLGEDANYVAIEIYTAKGYLLRKTRLGAHKKGAYQWFWDGRTDTGEKVAAGTYYVTVRTEYGMVTGKFPLGGGYGCLENLVAGGWKVRNAAEKCNVALDFEEDIDVERCIAGMIQMESKSYQDAKYYCQHLPEIEEIYVPPTTPASPTLAPAMTPGILPPTPELDEEPEKKMPGWFWGVLVFGGLFLFTMMKK